MKWTLVQVLAHPFPAQCVSYSFGTTVSIGLSWERELVQVSFYVVKDPEKLI